MEGDPPAPDLPDGEGDAPADGDGSSTAFGSPRGDGDQPADRVAHFLRLLSDDDEITRFKAAEALGRIGDPAAAGPLIDTLWDDDARVRLKAAWALGMIGDPRAAPALRRLYRMEREEAREIIKEALDAINRQAGYG